MTAEQYRKRARERAIRARKMRQAEKARRDAKMRIKRREARR